MEIKFTTKQYRVVRETLEDELLLTRQEIIECIKKGSLSSDQMVGVEGQGKKPKELGQIKEFASYFEGQNRPEKKVSVKFFKTLDSFDEKSPGEAVPTVLLKETVIKKTREDDKSKYKVSSGGGFGKFLFLLIFIFILLPVTIFLAGRKYLNLDQKKAIQQSLSRWHPEMGAKIDPFLFFSYENNQDIYFIDGQESSVVFTLPKAARVSVHLEFLKEPTGTTSVDYFLEATHGKASPLSTDFIQHPILIKPVIKEPVELSAGQYQVRITSTGEPSEVRVRIKALY